ncbi:cellulose binding domain-containing protein [Nonomuraea sp. NPDC049784]|uniref:cellulose binding domain-containing protein n=1 Tax=Nonomuraea sp. NPDC049784 TaxID=3154361 RepID=UPI0033FFEF06
MSGVRGARVSGWRSWFWAEQHGWAATCTAVPTVQTQWATGYVIQPLTITNTGTSTINGWTVTFTLPAGHTLTGSWNGTATVSGQTVTIRNVS